MTIQRLENVGIVVDDIGAAVAGLRAQGRGARRWDGAVPESRAGGAGKPTPAGRRPSYRGRARSAHRQEVIPMPGELRTSIDIDATPDLVWEVLTDVHAYPEWSPLLAGAEGTFADGGRVVFRFPPLNALMRTTVPAIVLEVSPRRRLRYVLRFPRLGIPGLLDTEHTLTIEDREGGVRLWLVMRFHGLLFPLMSRSLNRHRAPAFGPVPAALKERIEGMRAARGE